MEIVMENKKEELKPVLKRPRSLFEKLDKTDENEDTILTDKEKGFNVKHIGNSVEINDVVTINNGKILQNPFVKRLDSSESAQWVLANENEVRYSIQRRFRDLKIRGGDVDDCLDMVINEFNSRPELQFNKNYFGDSSNYRIREYILNRIKYIVLRYKTDLNDKKEVVPLLNSVESENYNGAVEEITVDNAILETSETVVGSDNVHWDDLFDSLVDSFQYFAEIRSYKKFDYRNFLIHFYFNVENYTSKKDLLKHYKKVAESCGESVQLVKYIVADLQEAIKTNKEDGLMVMNTVRELLEGKKHGWMPKNQKGT